MANAVLDGVDGILLGAETLRGKYPVETVQTVLAICHQAEKVFDHNYHFEHLMQARADPPPFPVAHTLHGCGDRPVSCNPGTPAANVDEVVLSSAVSPLCSCARYPPCSCLIGLLHTL